jgi:predicted NodU family carbamoyl transferase
MTVGERVDTRPCKAPGCPNSTNVIKGRYGGLCEKHREELAEEIRQGFRNGAKANVSDPNTNKAKIQALFKAAEKVDKTKAKAKDAIEIARKAQDDYRKILREMMTELQQSGGQDA